jgi:methylenetetrahydrofolate dehydrogenase (NADP+)/methenyltetrahydrofolate cyclohydrolase
MGYLLMGRPRFVAATPAGIMRLLLHYKLKVAGKHCVVVGRSNIVGKPLAILLLQSDATVTIAHSKTKNLAAITRQADFLFVAVGKANLIRASMVKKGAVVADVGMNKNKTGKSCGDVDFEGVKTVASWMTPVPGGVGPMTIMSLMANTLKAYELQQSKK